MLTDVWVMQQISSAWGAHFA